MDSLLSAGVTFSGRYYPEGLFLLNEDVAIKLAKNLLIINDSVPKLGKKAASVAAPMILASTLLTDLAGKGLILYGIVKSPKTPPGIPGPNPGKS